MKATSSQTSRAHASNRIWWTLGALLIVAGLFRIFVASRVTIPDGGLEPDIREGSTYWLTKRAYSDVRDIERGDIIAIDGRALGADRYHTLVWRVVAVPGEVVEVVPGQPLKVNGEQAQPHVMASDLLKGKFVSTPVPGNHVFVLGTRCCSPWDSYGLGPIPFSAVRGKVLH
jgi:signal peptidase I